MVVRLSLGRAPTARDTDPSLRVHFSPKSYIKRRKYSVAARLLACRHDIGGDIWLFCGATRLHVSRQRDDHYVARPRELKSTNIIKRVNELAELNVQGKLSDRTFELLKKYYWGP